MPITDIPLDFNDSDGELADTNTNGNLSTTDSANKPIFQAKSGAPKNCSEAMQSPTSMSSSTLSTTKIPATMGKKRKGLCNRL